MGADKSATKGCLNPMRRNHSQVRSGRGGLSGRSDLRGGGQSRILPPAEASDHRILSLERWKPNLDDSVDEVLSSALVAQDKELAGLLEDVDQISKSLKSDAPETQTLRDTLRRTVLCAVRQSLLDRELRSLALTDDLTCLYNRRAFLALAGQQLRVARRNGQGLLLFFADADHLKEINDSYGHREGDFALIQAADALERTFRNSDVIARLGGDEFAIIALEASCDNQEVILDRLERNLKTATTSENRYQLSLSVGMARFDPRQPVSLGKLIAMADEAMYEVKKNRQKLCVV
jgi:diguanylate cyclase (GGDEF)-like protein